MITGRWGKPSEVLLDLVVDEGGVVRGVVNPGRQNVPIRRGHFAVATGAIELEGEQLMPDGAALLVRIDGRLDGRMLRLAYQYGDLRGNVDLVRVEEYTPRRATLRDAVKRSLADVQRWLTARSRPTGEENARRLRERGESLESIVFRDAITADIPALAELHVTTWNATYNTTRGPSIATRTWQWSQVLANESRRDFVLVLEDQDGRLIGFTWGKPHAGEFAGEISKIYLRWEYHGLGLGRRMMAETAARFVERGMHSCILLAERSNPTIGFYERLGGERLLDDHGQFDGGYAWRDLTTLIGPATQETNAHRTGESPGARVRDRESGPPE
jgi:ribosomal protein S18 acetylase RimI-like enzyme